MMSSLLPRQDARHFINNKYDLYYNKKLLVEAANGTFFHKPLFIGVVVVVFPQWPAAH